MKARRFTYADEFDSDELTPQERYLASYLSSNRLAFVTLAIEPSQLSVDGSEWLHVVEATKRKNYIVIRVITNTYRGLNIWIPNITDTLYAKYLDLRFQIRNSEKVLITFPELYIRSSGYKNELLLRANDFKLLNPNETQPAQPKVKI